MTPSDVRLEARLPVPPAAAWALLTEARHIRRWWGPHVTLDARPHGAFAERWSDAGRSVVTSGTVLRWEPPVALALSWADDDWPAATEVTFRLVPHGEGTRLELVHAGWSALPADRRAALVAAHAAGWAAHLDALARYAEAG